MANIRRQNFDLEKSTRLGDIDLRRKGRKAELSQGLRDIGQEKKRGVEGVVNNALQRGIFRSGIRRENVAEVEREAGEAQSDLRSDISIALDRLSNERRGVAGRQLQPLTGSGSGGMGGFAAALQEFIDWISGEFGFGDADINDVLTPEERARFGSAGGRS